MKRTRSWVKVGIFCVIGGAVAILAPVLVDCYKLFRAGHHPDHVKRLKIDVCFIDGSQASVLDQFFADPLPEDASPTVSAKGDDVYLLARVAYRPVSEEWLPWPLWDLVIEIVDPYPLKGQRYTIVPAESPILDGMCYSLFKVKSRFQGPAWGIAPGDPVTYKVVSISAQ